MFIYNQEQVNHRQSSITLPVKQTVDINGLFMEKIISLLRENTTILDIGTGNGYVLSQILKSTDISTLKMYGVDNAPSMVTLAQANVTEATIIQADNNALPFEDGSFDIVTAKNVTRFSSSEIYRVLKPNGFFIFREYGPSKGLKEIAELFPGRLIRSRNPEFYGKDLLEAGFVTMQIEPYLVTRTYSSVDEIINITKSFPFIEGYCENDEALIREHLNGSSEITSDPFILVAHKL